MFKKITREPLVHFLLGGFLLFIYFKSCSANDNLANSIRVDKEAILNFMQFQSKAFNKDVFETQWEAFSKAEKQQIIDNYIQEEALYQEAIKLGLDQSDFVIKRRIVQKMEFILDDFDESLLNITTDSIQAYYDQHKERYFQSEQYTFTHIFFKNDDLEKAKEKALVFMKSTTHQNLSTAESLPFGDRFLYHRNYAEKGSNFLEGQFGHAFTLALSKMNAFENKWQGPILSDHGWHWIKLVDRSEAQYVELAKIHSTVKSDYLGYLKQEHKKRRIKKLVEAYNIENEF